MSLKKLGRQKPIQHNNNNLTRAVSSAAINHTQKWGYPTSISKSSSQLHSSTRSEPAI
jgi:hypothetical protein